MYTHLRPLTRFFLASFAAIALSVPVQAVPVTYTGGGFDIPEAGAGTGPGDGIGTIVVPDLGAVTNFLNVQITISNPHTFRADLSAFLTSPTGTIVALFPNLGGSGNWLAGTFTLVDGGGAAIPDGGEGPVDWDPGTYNIQGGSYASYLGVQGNGLWTLTINDNFEFDSGSASSWAITFDQDAIVADAPELDGSAATMPMAFFLGIGLLLGGKRRKA